MRRKFLLASIGWGLIITAASGVYAIERTDKVPSFFMPANALKSTAETERLPSIKQMQQKIQPQNQEAANSQNAPQNMPQVKNEEEKSTLTAKESPSLIEKEPKTVENSSEQPTLPVIEKQFDEELQEIRDTSQTKAGKNTLPEEENNNKEATPNYDAKNNVATFEQIQQEYINDLQKIINGKAQNNERLNGVVRDFKDAVREL